MKRWLWLLLLVACDDPTPAATTSSATATARAAVGLAAPDNDPAVVSAARAVLTGCDFNQSGGYFLPTCDAVKAFQSHPALDAVAGQRTLVTMLADADPRVRGLAARGLVAKGRAYRSDGDLAQAAIAALARETHKGVALQLADAVARISGKASHSLDALKQVAASHPMREVRARLIGPLLGYNAAELFDFVKTRASADPDEQVRVAAVTAFWGNAPKQRHAEVCAFWLACLQGDGSVAGRCGYYLAAKRSPGHCGDHYDAALAAIARHAEAGTAADGNFASALMQIDDSPHASEAQRREARRIAKVLADNPKNPKGARAQALRFLRERGQDDAVTR